MSQRGSLALIPRTKKGFVLFWAAILVMSLALQYVAATAPKAALAGGQSVDICHRTDSDNNPYIAESPDISSEGHLQGGHDTSHEGPIWNPFLKDAHIEWGDIIPPYTFQPADGPLFVYPGQNWPEGEQLLKDGCVVNLSMSVDKGVSLSADGPFVGNLTTTVGTTVYYRITITNTGNLALTGVTLSDNTYNLVAKGCTIPTTLAVGAHYDCNYSTSAVLGTTTNIATGDTAETGPDTGTATVQGNPPPAPALSITKGVSLTTSGFAASLTTEIGTTVHYRITVTNTGNVPLSSVTLTDNKFDLVAKGCTIPTTLAVGAHFDCDYTSIATAGVTENTATADSEETGPSDDTATVTGTTTPGLRVRKAVSTLAAGPFINILNVAPGTTVFYRITVTNTGNVALTGVTLTDNVFNLVAKGCTIPTTLAVGASFNCDYSSVSAETSTVNTATGDSNETGPDSDDATVNPVAQQLTPVVAIAKSNNAPAAPAGAKSGDTVTYTLDYTITDGPADNATIKDVLPAGVTYVTGSATDSENGEFVFAGYDSGTRTLTWTAVQLSENDSVSYKVTVDAGAAGIHQPLVNTACIVATGAAQACDTSDVFVAAGGVLAETSVPTAPRTDVLDANGSSAPGMNLGFALLIMGILAFAVLFVTPMPASVRNRIRRR